MDDYIILQHSAPYTSQKVNVWKHFFFLTLFAVRFNLHKVSLAASESKLADSPAYKFFSISLLAQLSSSNLFHWLLFTTFLTV